MLFLSFIYIYIYIYIYINIYSNTRDGETDGTVHPGLAGPGDLSNSEKSPYIAHGQPSIYSRHLFESKSNFGSNSDG